MTLQGSIPVRCGRLWVLFKDVRRKMALISYDLSVDSGALSAMPQMIQANACL